MNLDKYERISDVEEISKEVVFVELRDHFGNRKPISFKFEGDVYDDGQHLELFMRKEDQQLLINKAGIKDLKRGYKERNGRLVYTFERDEVYVKKTEL